MNHSLQCRCGTLKGQVRVSGSVGRGVCYCNDCQAYAHFLGKPREILDALGGTDVIATLPKRVTFTHGIESLACMSLTEKGLLRWYASCCNTPIGNTGRDLKFPYVGLVHNCIENSSQSIESSFGPVTMRVNPKGAKGKAPSMGMSTFAYAMRFMFSVLGTYFDGSYKSTPFFDPVRGTPVVAPKVLSTSEHERVMNAV